MKKIILLIIIVITPLSAIGQELFFIHFEDNEIKRIPTTIRNERRNSISKETTVVIGGLNNLDGRGNYINVFGTKFIIDSLDMNSDGTRHAVLRREDGVNFFNHTPTVNARLIPVGHNIKQSR